MKKLLAIALLLTGSAAISQQIRPNQIKPGSTGQVLQTIGGETAWGANGLATIANIAALRTYAGPASALNVVGYYSASVTSAPDGGGGTFIDTGAPLIPILTLTSVANADGSYNTAYTGSTPGCAANACSGYAVSITGFTNAVNSGGYFIVASTATTITVNNVFGVAETHAGTATPLKTEDGGVHILDTATNHVWVRQNVTPGDTYSAWFGVRSNTATSYDNCVQAQNAINYTSLVGGIDYDTYTHGKLHWQAGLIQTSCTLVDPETPSWVGTGRQNPGRGGTELQYTGASTPVIRFNGAGFSSVNKSFKDMTVSTDLSHPGTWTDLLELDGTPHPAGGSFQFDVSTFDNVQFAHATGAAVYFHVLPPVGAPIATFTGYISDGTGAAPGNILCVTSGTPAGNYWLTGSGIPNYTYILKDLDPALSMFGATCTGAGGGHPWLINISGSPLNISSETITQGFALGPYSQENMWTNIMTSAVGQFIKTDPYANGPQDNVFTLLNYSSENGQSISAGIAPVWADLSGFADFYILSPVYEGSAAASPYIYRVTQNGTIYNQYIENGTGGAPIHSIFEFPSGASNAKVKLIDGYLGAVNMDQGYATFQPYTDGNRVYVDNAQLFTASQLPYTQVGNATQNAVSQEHNSMPPTLNPNMTSWDSYRDMSVRCRSTGLAQQPCNLSIPQSVPFVDLHGGWLDGLKQGPLSISTSGLANEGIVVDANEGRVFEMVGTAGVQPVMNVTIDNIPADLKGQQITETIRWKFHTTTAGYVMCPFNLDTFNARGNGTLCASTQYLPDTWYTSWAVQVMPSSGSPVAFGSQIATGSPVLGGGTVTYDVSAIHIEAGINLPVTMVGGNPAQTLTWPCSAAPTYGAYIVGDGCTNSVPASGAPSAWVNTVAGSPGTWLPLANIP